MSHSLRTVATCAAAFALMAVVSGAGRVSDAAPANHSGNEVAETRPVWLQAELVPPVTPEAVTEVIIPVQIKGFRYLPDPVVVPAGSSVAWLNEDNAPHTSTGVGDAVTALNSGAIVFGQTFTQRFETPGTFPYYCVYHPNMLGTVVVTP
ncbi:MAG: hypothetical protein KC442_22040 [Thermomicrobiales bacterium]|nr:hypothetical protein [Thermomicrobiales bacterium]